MAKKISAEAVRQGKTATGAVTVDSGMGRLGMPAAEAAEQILAMRGLPNLKLDGIYSHFSSAFMRYDDYSLGQLASFKTLLAELKGAGLEFPNVHMAASDALNNFPDSTRPPFTLARCGINMYGYYDNEVHQSMRLAPVVELKTRLAAAEQEGRPAAAIDAIRLIENGLADLCDATLAVTAPAEVRVSRIMAREGIPEEYARARVAAQQSDAFYRDACGYTLVNDCATAEEFGTKARALLERILQEHKGR